VAGVAAQPPAETVSGGVLGGGSGGTTGFQETELRGHPYRHFTVAISVGAMALAWARQDGAPHGAAVVADHEINALGRIGDAWTVPQPATLAAALIMRPSIPVGVADAVWLAGGLAGARGAASLTGRSIGVWWPDTMVDRATDAVVGKVSAEVQLGPAQVRSAVVTLRFDLGALGIDADRREDLLGEVVTAFDQTSAWLAEGAEGCAQAAAAYTECCPLVGRRVKVVLLPKGVTRGVVRRVDDAARLELVSSTGMVERIAIDSLRRLEVAGAGPSEPFPDPPA